MTADPNSRHPVDWTGVTAVKPNLMEAFFAAGIIPRNGLHPIETDPDLAQAGSTLLEKWNTEYLLITLGEDGMILFQKNEPAHHIPTRARQVFDVSGAGDTAIGFLHSRLRVMQRGSKRPKSLLTVVPSWSANSEQRRLVPTN